jgi:hypothetical protein
LRQGKHGSNELIRCTGHAVGITNDIEGSVVPIRLQDKGRMVEPCEWHFTATDTPDFLVTNEHRCAMVESVQHLKCKVDTTLVVAADTALLVVAVHCG